MDEAGYINLSQGKSPGKKAAELPSQTVGEENNVPREVGLLEPEDRQRVILHRSPKDRPYTMAMRNVLVREVSSCL